jgi:hypothetical protein
VEGIDMSEVKDINIVEEQDHSMNHRLGQEDMNMVGSKMVEVDNMDTVEKHFYLINHRPEVEGMDTVVPPDEPPIRGGGYGYGG